MFVLDNLYDIIVFLDSNSIMNFSLTNKENYFEIEKLWKQIFNLRYNMNKPIFIPYIVGNELWNKGGSKIIFGNKCNNEKQYDEISKKFIIEEFVSKEIEAPKEICDVSSLIEYCNSHEIIKIDNGPFFVKEEMISELNTNKNNIFNLHEKILYKCKRKHLVDYKTICSIGLLDVTFNNLNNCSEKKLMINEFYIIYCIEHVVGFASVNPIGIYNNEKEIIINIVNFMQTKDVIDTYDFVKIKNTHDYVKNKIKENDIFNSNNDSVEILFFELGFFRQFYVYMKKFNL